MMFGTAWRSGRRTLCARISPDTIGIARSSSLLAASDVINRGGRFLITLLVAKEVGPEGYGPWVLALAAATVLANVGDLGLATVATREMARHEDHTRRNIRNLSTLVPLMVLVFLVSLLAISQVLRNDTLSFLLVVIGAGGAIEAGALLLLSPFRAADKMLPEALLRALQGSLLIAIGLSVLYLSDLPVQHVAWIYPTTATISALFAYAVLVRNYGAPRFAADLRLWGHLLLSGLPISLTVLLFYVYFRIDSFFLAFLKGDEAAGLYGAAFNFTFGLASATVMLGRAALPRFAAANPGAELRSAYIRTRKLAVLLTLTVSVGLVLILPIFLFAYGEEFSEVKSTYLVLAIVQGLSSLTHLNLIFLLARNRSLVVPATLAGGLSLNMAGNILLIPSYGPLGAAIAMLISEAAMVVAQTVLIARLLAREAEEPASRNDQLESDSIGLPRAG